MAGQLTIDTLKASSGVLATQNGMTGIAKAWVQFITSGTAVTINGSFNISSVTYTSAGQYTIAFTTALPNANYSIAGSGSVNQAATIFLAMSCFTKLASPYYDAPTTSSFGITFQSSSGGPTNPVYGCVVVYGS